ncbi:MAG: NADPH-dependent FMN reductase [Coraliomargarita sp.]
MIAVIVGTNRPNANSRTLAHQIQSIYAAMDEPVQILDLADLPAAAFTPEAYAEKPASLKPLTDAILNSSGLHIVVPEYNGSMPGVLKYFIDLLPFPESFEGRPVAFTGVAAGMFGALRPVEQLQQIFSYRNAYLFPNRVFIMGVHEALTDDGKITDEKLQLRLVAQAKGFAGFIRRLAD